MNEYRQYKDYSFADGTYIRIWQSGISIKYNVLELAYLAIVYANKHQN